MKFRDRLRAEWQQNPSARRFDLYVFPLLVLLMIAGLVVAIMSPKYRGIAHVTAVGAVFLTVALNYAARRPRNDR